MDIPPNSVNNGLGVITVITLNFMNEMDDISRIGSVSVLNHLANTSGLWPAGPRAVLEPRFFRQR